MGRLSTVSTARFGALIAALAPIAIGCEAGADNAPQKSRVQAVLVEPGAPAIAPTPEPVEPKAAAKPRASLCEGQLQRKPETFRPKRAPTRLSFDPAGHELPADPLAGGRNGGHWTWVNFWAAWCVPCKEELPLLLGWQKQLESKLTFSFISLDDDERQLREFLERQPVGGLHDTYWLPDGPARVAWLEALHLATEPELPLQLLVDPSGAVRCRVEGAVEASDLLALQRILRD